MLVDSLAGSSVVACTLSAPNTTNAENSRTVVFGRVSFLSGFVFRGNVVTGGSNGLDVSAISGSARFAGTVIENNLISNFRSAALRLSNQLAPVVRSNTMTTGFLGIWLTNCEGSLRVENNRVRVSSTALRLNICQGTADAPGLLANNFLVSTEAAGIELFFSTFHQRLYHNSVRSAGYSVQVSGGSDNQVRNNVLVSTGTDSNAGALLYTATGVSGSNHNVLFVAGTRTARLGGTDFATLADWQAATGLDSQSIRVDPQFVAPAAGDLTATAAALLGADQHLRDVVPTDINGTSRRLLSTIGANELPGPIVLVDPLQQSVLLNVPFLARVRTFATDLPFDQALFTLTYDPAVLQLDSFVSAPAFATALLTHDDSLGSLTFAGGSAQPLSGDTSLLTLYFRPLTEADSTGLRLREPTALLLSTDTLASQLRNGMVTITADDPLPIRLNYFRGQQADNDVALTWQTARESQNDYFTLERAHADFAFEQVAQMSGAGESSRALTYTYTDPMAAAYAREHGLNHLFYRLWQTDYDGTRTLASTVRVALASPGGWALTAYPNPFTDEVTISYRLVRAQRVRLQLYDARGICLDTREIESAAGQTSMSLGHSGLPAGVYLLRVQSAESTKVVRLVKF